MDGEPKIAFPSIKTTYFMDGNKVTMQSEVSSVCG